MSDGPHKSLPLNPRWKRLAERAWKAAYDEAEVDEALPHALVHDFNEAPLSEIAALFSTQRQGTLFGDNTVEQLEAARRLFPGALSGLVIDCATEAHLNGLHGLEAARAAVQAALRSHAEHHVRQIEEHFHRTGAVDAEVIERLRGACERCLFEKLAGELLSGEIPVQHARLSRRSGLDEGPPL